MQSLLMLHSEQTVPTPWFVSPRTISFKTLPAYLSKMKKIYRSFHSNWLMSICIREGHAPIANVGPLKNWVCRKWRRPDYAIVGTNGIEQTYLSTEDDYNNNGKPWFNFHMAAGREWRLKWGHIIQVMIKVNFSPTKFFSGAYKFHVGNQPEVSGSHGVTGSYIGLNLSYVFSAYKKVKEG